MSSLHNNGQFSLPFLRYFKQSLFWNLFDSVGTQGLLILYHILFRLFYGSELHGKVGCTLSVFYLCIIIFNVGLDFSFAPFFAYFTKNTRTFRQFILYLLLPQLLFLTGIVSIFYTYFDHLKHFVPFFKTFGPVGSVLLASIGLTFLTESIKKTIKTFLQLAFYTRLTSLVEVLGMLVYMSIIFMSTFIGTSITLDYTWQVLGCISCIQLIALSLGAFVFYNSLPKASSGEWQHLPARITKTRVFAWSNQCIQQLFSGNFLVPICAIQFGLEQASLMKVLTSISYWITLIGNKVIGITGNALLAHVKNRSLDTQRKAFEYISYLLTQSLYFLLIFLVINGKKIALLQSAPSGKISWSLLYFLLILSFLECFFVIYEKWYIFEEKASIYFFFNLVSFSALYLFYSLMHSTPALLVFIIGLRLLTFFALTFFSFYRWNIWPTLKPDIRSIGLSLVLAIFCYIVLR